jgi:NADH-quinone oxidoreductase subunit L
LLVVVFFGRARTDIARHGSESPAVMTIPLVLLAIPAALSGFGIVARKFLILPNEKQTIIVPILAFVAMVCGIALAVTFYRNKQSEPLNLTMLRNRFYIDEFYAWLIEWTQGLLARLAAFFDRWIIDGAAVRGSSGTTWGAGYLLRLLQVGNLQAYGFFFGLGIIGLVYFAVFS